MTATLQQLLTARDKDTVLAQMYATAATLGVDVVGVQAERLFRALYEIEAASKAREDRLRVQIAQAGFLSTVRIANTNIYDDGTTDYIAPPNWTDLIAGGFFGLTRYPAYSTIGAAVLTCSALAAAGTVPAMQARFQSDEATGGQWYRNRYAFTVTPGRQVPVILVADVPGSSGNVPVNSITHIVTTLAGCSLNNPGTGGSWITTTGADYESDDNLIARCFARWAASSYGGARSAYAQWVADAFTAAGVTPTVTRIGVDDTNPNGPGSTDIYLASVTGPATVEDVALVDAYLQPRRALGTGPLRVFSAPGVTIPVHAALYGNANGVALGTAALTALGGIVGIGGAVYLSAIYAALTAPSVPGIQPPLGRVEVYAPTADVELTGFQVPVFSANLTATA